MSLSNTEIEKLAKMLNWKSASGQYWDEESFNNYDATGLYAEYELREGWHLTKAGAWDVLVGLKWELINTGDNEHAEFGWKVRFMDVRYDADPLTSLTLAVKEYLK